MTVEKETHLLILDEASKMSAAAEAETWAWFKTALAEGRVTQTIFPARDPLSKSLAHEEIRKFLEQRRK